MGEPSLAARIRAARARVALDKKMNRSSRVDVLELAQTPIPAGPSAEAARAPEQGLGLDGEVASILARDLLLKELQAMLRMLRDEHRESAVDARSSVRELSTFLRNDRVSEAARRWPDLVNAMAALPVSSRLENAFREAEALASTAFRS